MPKQIAKLSIQERLDWLAERNSSFVKEFNDPGMANARALYCSQHPTQIMAFKCMDGRIHIPVMANMPLGTIRPMRSLGGYFDLGWPYLGELVRNWINLNLRNGHSSLVLITYHYSEGDHHRGCAGFDYDQQASCSFTNSFLEQFAEIFGRNDAVYPLIMGIETDSEAFIFHNGEHRLDLREMLDSSQTEVRQALQQLLPTLRQQMLEDLLPLALGNIEHIKQIKLSNRPVVESEHLEWMVGLGRGFDWLHEPNVALIIGPYNPDMSGPLNKAFGLIQKNLREGKFNGDGFVMLSSGLYNDPISAGYQQAALETAKRLAREKALFFQDFADRVVKKNFPELASIIHHLPVIVDYHTRQMEPVSAVKAFTRMPF
jgi:hypothetical protein